MTLNLPDVSLIVPCRNEVSFVEAFLDSMRRQVLGDLSLEILIADGMSDDGTRSLLERRAMTDPRIRIIDNPERIVPTGLNRAIRQARGAIVIRCDVHTEYEENYLRRSVETLKDTNAANVGGPWNAAGRTPVQAAIASAFRSPFASGGALSHDPGYSGEVDSVYLGCWRRETLLQIGLFDEEFVRNQDDELNLRIRRSGGKIWQTPSIISTYYPRSSILDLFRQYMQYGYWKVRVIQKHKLPASIRHLVPGAFVLSCLALAGLSLFSASAAIMLVALLAAYVSANLAFSALTSYRESSWWSLPLLPPVFAAYHFGYGYGFLRGVVDFVLLSGQGRSAFRNITRR